MSVPGKPARASTDGSGALIACRALDALLFASDGWFAIDASNRKVPGVTPGALDQALALVGSGRVATVVGRLRPEVVGVDVDAGGALGDEAVGAVVDWCAARGLWHLQRPSGGGPGRWHVLVVPGVHADDLDLHLAAVRRELQLTGKQLDRRAQLRPLSAPHRRTGATPAPQDLPEALAGLQAVLEPLPSRVRERRAAATAAATAGRTASGPAEPLVPLARPRRALPAPWGAYLSHGRRAAASVDRSPDERSQIELEATFALVVAGYAEPEAWNVVTTAHPTAFVKARARGRRWWWNQWNRAVVDADAWLRQRRAAAATHLRARQTSPAVLRAVQHARTALETLWRTWPTRTRHTDAEIYTVVLDRLARTDTLAAAIPQRDLILDSAVSSRTTVRAALTRLQNAGLLEVLPTYVPGTTDTAHTLALPARFTDSDEPQGTAVSVTDPSRFQPPQPAPASPIALPLRRALGLAACAVLAHLRSLDQPCSDLAALAHAAGLLETDQDTPTPRQVRTLRGHLRTLAQHQLVDVDEGGRWRPRAEEADPDTQLTRSVERVAERRGAALGEAVQQRINTERAEFRAVVDPDARRTRWQAQRHAALARAAKAARARQQAWWGSQDPRARDRRRTALSAAFLALSPVDQGKRKHDLAMARARAGEHEPSRYAAWLAEIDPAELEQRALDRAARFAGRPLHERQQLAAAWAEHRARWQLPHLHRGPRQPTNAVAAESALLARQSPDIDELVDQLALFTPGRPAQSDRAG